MVSFCLLGPILKPVLRKTGPNAREGTEPDLLTFCSVSESSTTPRGVERSSRQALPNALLPLSNLDCLSGELTDVRRSRHCYACCRPRTNTPESGNVSNIPETPEKSTMPEGSIDRTGCAEYKPLGACGVR